MEWAKFAQVYTIEMNKIASLIVIFIIVFGFDISNSTLAGQDQQPFEIISLNDSVRKLEIAKLIILLPKKGQKYSKWELISPGATIEKHSGMLGTELVRKDIALIYKKPGKYKIIGILTGVDDFDLLHRSNQITVDESTLFIWSEKWGGTIVGAFLAVVVFLSQSIIAGILKKVRRKKQFNNSNSFFIKEIKEKILTPKQIRIPNWLNDPANSQWIDLVYGHKKFSELFEIRKILAECKANYIKDEEAKEKLENLAIIKN